MRPGRPHFEVVHNIGYHGAVVAQAEGLWVPYFAEPEELTELQTDLCPAGLLDLNWKDVSSHPCVAIIMSWLGLNSVRLTEDAARFTSTQLDTLLYLGMKDLLDSVPVMSALICMAAPQSDDVMTMAKDWARWKRFGFESMSDYAHLTLMSDMTPPAHTWLGAQRKKETETHRC
jgi:hypothetical protein